MVAHPPELVSELIDATSATWREDLIWATFNPYDAQSILRIPLCTHRVDDFWAWAGDPKGRFSVSSAYKMIYNMKMGREAWLEESDVASNLNQEVGSWKSLWKTTIS